MKRERLKHAIRCLVALFIAARLQGITSVAAISDANRQPEDIPGAVVKGTLCFAGGFECTSTRGLMLEVPQLTEAHRYVWMRHDYREIFVGELAAGASVIDLKSKETPLRTISLGIRGHASRSWPADVNFTVWKSKESEWKWQLPAEASGRDIEVHVPPGNYVLFIEAPRHYKLGRRLPSETRVALGMIELKPLPVIRGRVVQLDGKRVTPVLGAQIHLGDGKVADSTDEQGRFRVELSQPIAKEMMIASPGFGAQIVKLGQLEADNDLGEIRLEAGVTLTLEIDRPEDLREKLVRVRVLRHDDNLNHSQVAQGELASNEDEREFRDLSAGQYYVILEGGDPLERMFVPVDIGREDVMKAVSIRPFRLKGKVLLGEEPLRRGEVEIMPTEAGQNLWRTRLKIDEDGSFGALLWQPGRLNAFIHGHGMGGVLSDKSPELGIDPSLWTIRFKDRAIHGRIFDSESGGAAQNVRLELKTTGVEGGSRSSETVAADGEYRIVAWRNGIYDLIVSARDYLPVTKTIELTEMNGSRQVDFALERGFDVKLEFFWSTGQKILSPSIYEGVARDGRNPEREHRTDAAGILKLSVPAGTSRLIYVLPREGSFVPVRVTARRSSGDEPVRVEIPPGMGSLRVHVKDRAGERADGLIMMRYNGEWIPYPITVRLRQNSSAGLTEFGALPAGAYELWAVKPREGYVPASLPPPAAPVRAGVAAGETNVEATLIEFP